LFLQHPKAHANTWKAVIVACAQNEQFRNGLHLFEKMNDAGVIPDKDTFVSTLAACANECH
jgi:pentatricopeptide repeat protein